MPIKKTATTLLETEYGKFDMQIFVDLENGNENIVLSQGIFNQNKPVLLRIHSECITGEVFHSSSCDCASQLAVALKNISQEGCGILIYLRQEGRGIGLTNKIKAYSLQQQGLDTVEANTELGLPIDSRNYNVALEILKIFNIKKIRLMTNNPQKILAFENSNFEIVERIPIEIKPNKINRNYLETKKEKMGHLLNNI